MAMDPYSPNTALTLAAFSVGPSNEDAVTASARGAAAPSAMFTLLCGPPGVGKTHLLHALGNAQTAHGRTATYVGCHDLAAELITEARGAGTATSYLMERMAHSAAVLVDDLHFLEDKPVTTTAMAHLLATIHNAGVGVAMAGTPGAGPARLVVHLRELVPNCRRFEIGRPDRTLRRRLAQSAAHSLGINLDAEVTDYIAGAVTGSAREIHGAVQLLKGYTTTYRIAPSLDLTISLLNHVDRVTHGY